MPDLVAQSLLFTRTLRKGDSGEDVWAAKQRLFFLGMYDIPEIKSHALGSDSIRAIKKFQCENGLEVDGVIGPLTWAALFNFDALIDNDQGAKISGFEVLDYFSSEIRSELIPELQAASDLRREICLDALQYAIDPYNPPQYPRSLYIRGGNLYNKDLTANVITVSRIKSGAQRQPEYYDGGRMEFMIEVVDNNPDTTGADCSGGIVGLGRKHEVFSATFDANANTLRGTHSTLTTDPSPGDWHWKDGHIGLYVGAGLTVEWVGGAYGCQLTRDSDRRVYSYMDGRLHKFSGWTEYRNPKRY